MKIIDQTPFFKNGEIGLMDRGRAVMKFGSQWLAEVKAQQAVASILERVLDKNYTLLVNVTPPGLGITIPYILVGPPGVFVMYVTPLTGNYRAKGEQWGTVSGNTFKPEKLNLLTRTERLARAIQMHLQRQGYSALASVEAILICAETRMYVDSVRPVIRIVMRDALERLAVSITQARALLSPETVHEVVDRLLNPPKASVPAPQEAVSAPLETPSPAGSQAGEPYVPAFVQPEEQPARLPESSGSTTGFEGSAALEDTAETTPALFGSSPESARQTTPRPRRGGGISRRQWFFLISMFLIWCAIMVGFAYLVLQDFR